MLTRIRQALVGNKVGAAESDAAAVKKQLLRFGIGATVSFLLTRLRLLGGMEGLGFSAAAAMPLPFTVAGWIGCFLGEFFDGLDRDTLFRLIALLFWIAAKKAVQRSMLPKHFTGLFWQTAVLGTLLSTKAVITYFTADLTLMDLVRQLLQVMVQIVVFMTGVIFFQAFFSDRQLVEYSSAEGAGGIVLGVLLLASLGRYQFIGVQPAGIAAVTVSAICAYRYGWIGSAVGGILSAIGLVLGDSGMMEFAALMVLGIFLAGTVAYRSKLFAAAAIVTVHFVLVLVYGKPLQMLPLSVSILLGVALFLMIPVQILDDIQLPQVVQGHDPPQDGARWTTLLQDKLQLKMEFAADTVEMLNESMAELAEVWKTEVRPDPEVVYQMVEMKLCRHCRRRSLCYGTSYDQVRESFNRLNGKLRKREIPMPEEFPQFLKEQCIRPGDLIRVFTESYDHLRFESEQQRQVGRFRELVTEQYTSIAGMLKELGAEISLTPDPETEQRLTEALSKEGYCPQRLQCGRDENDRLYIELYYSHDLPPSGELTELIQRQLQMKLADPVILDAQHTTRISLYEPPRYGVQAAVIQKASRDNTVNGDTVTQFFDGRGNFYLLLSDGMGRGRQAALDSRTVCTVLSKLIISGFGWQTAMRFLNTVLTVKSAKESLATVDIVRINLYTGETEFIKAGAASSYWINEKNVTRIRSFTLPLGIISGIRFDSRKVTASPGDTMLLLSDGMTDEEAKVGKLLFSVKDDPVKQMAEKIFLSLSGKEDKKSDDCTAAAVRLICYTSENADGT